MRRVLLALCLLVAASGPAARPALAGAAPGASLNTSASNAVLPTAPNNLLANPIGASINTSGTLATTNTTASTSTTTGALTVAGGLGVGGAINAGGTLALGGSPLGISYASNEWLLPRSNFLATCCGNNPAAGLHLRWTGIADGVNLWADAVDTANFIAAAVNTDTNLQVEPNGTPCSVTNCFFAGVDIVRLAGTNQERLLISSSHDNYAISEVIAGAGILHDIYLVPDGNFATPALVLTTTDHARLNNNTYLYGRNAAGTADLPLIGSDGANNTALGQSGTRTYSNGPLYANAAVANYIGLNGNLSGFDPLISATGSDANIKLDIGGAGTLGVRLLSLGGPTVLADFETTGTYIYNAKIVQATKTANYTILSTDSGTYFDNTGAVGTVIFTLPAYSAGLRYCFQVTAAQIVEVLAPAATNIAVGTTNSAAAGNIQNNIPYSSVCLVATGVTNQWTADRATGTWTIN